MPMSDFPLRRAAHMDIVADARRWRGAPGIDDVMLPLSVSAGAAEEHDAPSKNPREEGPRAFGLSIFELFDRRLGF